ncbi:MAG: hypothetical protein OXT67_13025 [Zetaproteobacteria bacterium]|nr:hypothetical protein [Zetaproteobacteria bacterium]
MQQAYEVALSYLQDHLESTVYERISYFDSMIKSFKYTSQKSTLHKHQLNHSIAIKLSENSADFDGGNCVFLTHKLNSSLPGYLRPNMIKSKVLKKHYQEGFPRFCHSATLIKCSNGYLLLDSGYGLSRPIKLELDGSKDSYQMGKHVWKYSLNKKHRKIIWEVFTLDGEFVESTYYRLKCAGSHIKIHNEISTQAALADRKLTAVFRDRDGFKTANIKIDLLKKNIKITQMWQDVPVTLIPFSELEHLDLNAKIRILKQYFDPEFCKRVRIEQHKFTRMIAFVIDNYNFIEDKILPTPTNRRQKIMTPLARLPKKWLPSVSLKLQRARA